MTLEGKRIRNFWGNRTQHTHTHTQSGDLKETAPPGNGGAHTSASFQSSNFPGKWQRSLNEANTSAQPARREGLRSSFIRSPKDSDLWDPHTHTRPRALPSHSHAPPAPLPSPWQHREQFHSDEVTLSHTRFKQSILRPEHQLTHVSNPTASGFGFCSTDTK